MPLYFRYLLTHYLKAWGATLATVLSLLIVLQFTEMARFASFGVPWPLFAKFLLWQVPLLLWIAIPIASFVGGILTVRRLSSHCEITALRSLGLSLNKILGPLLIVSLFISVGLFYIYSELSTRAHLRCREMTTEATAINPIVMLQHSAAMQLKQAFVQMDSISPGREVANLIVAFPAKQLVLYLADHLKIVDGELQSTGAAWMTTLSQPEGFDPLIVETADAGCSPALELATIMRTRGLRIAQDYLNWRQLLARKRLLRAENKECR